MNSVSRIAAVGVAAAALLGVGWMVFVWTPEALPRKGPRDFAISPARLDRATQPQIMNTTFHLAAVLPAHSTTQPQDVFARADRAARRVERDMNHHAPTSEVSRFNAAAADQFVPLSPPTLQVLHLSQRLHAQTNGAFDVSALPLIEMWKGWTNANQPPNAAGIAIARGRSRWTDIVLSDRGARKRTATACVDLGGIAKGFALDLAAEQMISDGCRGGFVEIGGDVRCFGGKPDGEAWRVAIGDPFAPDSGEPLVVLGVHDAGVCTSGNYRRFITVNGRRYSHIVDPRSGLPAEVTPSVTVIAREAALADGWATALSVLGPDGLGLLEGRDIEAMMVMGADGEHATYPRTAGFDRYVLKAPARWAPTTGAR